MTKEVIKKSLMVFSASDRSATYTYVNNLVFSFSNLWINSRLSKYNLSVRRTDNSTRIYTFEGQPQDGSIIISTTGGGIPYINIKQMLEGKLFREINVNPSDINHFIVTLALFSNDLNMIHVPLEVVPEVYKLFIQNLGECFINCGDEKFNSFEQRYGELRRKAKIMVGEKLSRQRFLPPSAPNLEFPYNVVAPANYTPHIWDLCITREGDRYSQFTIEANSEIPYGTNVWFITTKSMIENYYFRLCSRHFEDNEVSYVSHSIKPI
jgi:hypothetical protein